MQLAQRLGFSTVDAARRFTDCAGNSALLLDGRPIHPKHEDLKAPSRAVALTPLPNTELRRKTVRADFSAFGPVFNIARVNNQ